MWCNGNTGVSKTLNGGSIPSTGAIQKVYLIVVILRFFTEMRNKAGVAQLVEQRSCKAKVGVSSTSSGTIHRSVSEVVITLACHAGITGSNPVQTARHMRG